MLYRELIKVTREKGTIMTGGKLHVEWKDSDELAPGIVHYLPVEGVGVLSLECFIEELGMTTTVNCYVSCTKSDHKPELVYDILYTANHRAKNSVCLYKLVDTILDNPQDFGLSKTFRISGLRKKIVQLKLQEAKGSLRIRAILLKHLVKNMVKKDNYGNK